MSECDNLLKRIKKEIVDNGGIVPEEENAIIGYDPNTDTYFHLTDLDKYEIKHGVDYL
ncbi:hypothetical protein J4406_01515 [Candidatus Woesearchaeota archaeon]|nr:hypothetical protein [Candidatus Woesearchaeota archaeon]